MPRNRRAPETVSPAGEYRYRRIEAIREVLPWQRDLAPVIARGAAPSTRVISFTVTEAGYSLDARGQLDLSFGASGKASLDIYNGDNSPYGLTVQPDGKAIVGGNSVVTNSSGSRTYYFTLVRFDAAGNPDGAFGPGSAGPGVVTTRFDGTTMSSYLYSLGLQADGKILAAGVADISPVVVRYLQ